MNGQDPLPNLTQVIRSRAFIALTISLFGTFVIIALVSANATAFSDRYISMSTLDYNLTSNHYFSQSGHSLHPGDKMQWNIDVYNHMGQVEYVSIRAKLLGAAQQAPNDSSQLPAEGRVVFEKKAVVADNSTILVPFDWTIAKPAPGHLGHGSLVVNGQTISGFVAPTNGEKLRMVFELWRYDINQNAFSFTWPSDSGTKDIWNEIWFSIGT